MPLKSCSFGSLQGKQICPGRQQWIVMINAEREAGTAGIGKAIVPLPNSRKARGHLAFLRSMRFDTRYQPPVRCVSARAVFEASEVMFCAFRLWACARAAAQVVPYIGAVVPADRP